MIPAATELGTQLVPVTLDELNLSADLQTRVDRKYVLGSDLLCVLRCEHRDLLAMLDIEGRRSFEYSSIYFDTPDFALHRAAATDRRHRVKVRTRVYEDSDTAMVELKAKDGRGNTVKHRHPHDISRAGDLGESGRAFVDDMMRTPGFASSLVPTLSTRYRRTTLVDLAAGARATLDTDLVCEHVDGRFVIFDRVIVETKSGLSPSMLDRWMWSRGMRPERISKYCTALALFEPHLPANKWRRTIARHFTP
jgi:hypothetical protein